MYRQTFEQELSSIFGTGLLALAGRRGSAASFSLNEIGVLQSLNAHPA